MYALMSDWLLYLVIYKVQKSYMMLIERER